MRVSVAVCAAHTILCTKNSTDCLEKERLKSQDTPKPLDKTGPAPVPWTFPVVWALLCRQTCLRGLGGSAEISRGYLKQKILAKSGKCLPELSPPTCELYFPRI